MLTITKKGKIRKIYYAELVPIGSIDRHTRSVQLDNSSYNAFISQFIFCEWQMALMRRCFCVLRL